MRMSLEKMVIENFKGTRKLTIDFAEETHIFGMNGTGKTTIPDAFSWVLFNKDSKGNAPGSDNFREKPLDTRFTTSTRWSSWSASWTGRDST